MWTVLKQQVWRWRGIFLTIPSVAGGLLLLRLAGALQFMELVALDQMFRLRPVEPVDPRIVLVTIDESDIKQLGQWPMSDAALARLITSIKQQQPQVIGLDIFRDLPVEPGHAELSTVFSSTPNLIGVEKVIKTAQGEVIQAPPVLKQRDQVSASDLLLDTDGRIRRSLLYLSTRDDRSIATLGAQLAFAYLKARGIQFETINSRNNRFRLGRAVFTTLQPNDGGYIRIDAGGYQILSNFPKFPNGFHTISMTDVLQNRIPKKLMRDRIILIGLTAESIEDKFFTSYTTDGIAAPAGAEVHALLTSQLLSAALDGRPLLSTWSEPLEWLWVIGCATVGAVVGCASPSPRRMIVRVLLFSLALVIVAFLMFLAGWWLLVITPLIALIGSAIVSNGYLLWENLKDYANTLEQKVQERTLKLQQEIVERQQAELALGESEARFRQLSQATVEAIIVTEQGNIVDVNDAFTQMFGYSTVEAIEMLASDLAAPDYQEVVTQNMQSHYEGFYEIVCLRNDGTPFPAEIHAKVTTYGEQIVRIASIRDISDRKRAEEASVLDERNRMAREIHDTLAQAFTSIIIHLEAATLRLTTDLEAAQALLKTGSGLARSGLAEARRSVEALRPQVLENRDLCSALQELAEQIFSHTATQVICTCVGEAYPLASVVENNLLRIGQEALNNAVKYAKASEVRVDVIYERPAPSSTLTEPRFTLRIKDDGEGFILNKDLIGGFGLLSMTERAERIGAQLTMQSAPGQGTEIVVSVIPRNPL